MGKVSKGKHKYFQYISNMIHLFSRLCIYKTMSELFGKKIMVRFQDVLSHFLKKH